MVFGRMPGFAINHRLKQDAFLEAGDACMLCYAMAMLC